jgi:hypothetical protein
VTLTTEQGVAVKAALARYLKSCPICGTNAWSLAQDVYFIPVFTLPGTPHDPSGQPCISAVCNTCGSVQLFNLFKLGVAEKFGIKPSEAAKSDG